MIQPSLREFKRLARHGNLIALRMEVPSDLETPVSTFLKLASSERNAFLLESAEQEERIGRYSFLGFEPETTLLARGGNLFLEQGERRIPLAEKDLLNFMRRTLKKFRVANPEGLPNFAGGWVGFLGYENVRLFEKISLRQKNGLQLDDAVFFLSKDFVLFDHFKKTLSFVSLCEARPSGAKSLKRIYEESCWKMTRFAKKLERHLPHRWREIPKHRSSHIAANLTRNEFNRCVRRVKEYIRAGDCIQAVFSQRFNLGRVQDDFAVYRALRSINPSPYMFYFRHGPLRLIGSSPELLVRKTGRDAEARPIAGTRVRGRTEEEDERLEGNLRRSKKEMAEHLMLVDLGRNDLGRVCEFRTIHVAHFASVERYSHVMHLVSGVTGRLKAGKDAFDLLRAAFPAGTVTGAPKIRAMEIIDELEPERRGPYAGCLGYFSFTGDMDMCITIRTIVVSHGQAYVQAGAGIVYDSLPEKEYKETLNKAEALVQAVTGGKA